jgi:MFS transporter, DHA1 family, chloramphenicol resistance protein
METAVPLLVWLLGAGILMIAGLLPRLAADLGVSVPDAGLLVTGFAAGMLIGAPVPAFPVRSWSPRAALVAVVGVFAAPHADPSASGAPLPAPLPGLSRSGEPR